MPCCGTLAGITRDCSSNQGGIRRIWVKCFNPDIEPTVTAGVISALGDTTGWFEIEVRRQTSNFTINRTRDDAAGTLFYQIDLNIVIAKMTTEKSRALYEMDRSDLKFIVQDNNGIYWYLGYNNYVGAGDTGTAQTGASFTDTNGYDLIYTDFSETYPYEVSATAMSPILGGS